MGNDAPPSCAKLAASDAPRAAPACGEPGKGARSSARSSFTTSRALGVDFWRKRAGWLEGMHVRQSAPTTPAPSEPARSSAYEGFKQVYQATIGMTASWLYRLKVSRDDWDDAIQEIYLEAWRSWNTYDSTRGTHRQWLYGIAVNVASRYRGRRGLKYEREEPLADDFDAASTSPNGGDYMEINDRARFTVRFFEGIDTLPLVIMIAHDMNNEPMKKIAKRHQVSLSEAYRLRGQARSAFIEGYNREQDHRRKSGAYILPFSALSLLAGPHEIPEVPADFKEHLWSRIAQAIGDGVSPLDSRTPSHDASARPRSPVASVPPSPHAPTSPHVGRSAVRVLRSALTANRFARPAAIFICGGLTALGGERLLDALARNTRASISQETPAANVAEAPIAFVANTSPTTNGTNTEPAASSNAEAKREAAPAGGLTPAEAAQFDVVRAAFKSPDPDKALKAIQDYLKVYPRGLFAGACEKMRIQTLAHAGRIAEARTALEHRSR